MTFREIFRFELAYQIRRVATWVCFAALFVFGLVIIWAADGDASAGGTPADRAFLGLAFVTGMGSVLWLLLAGTVAGDAAARDIETRMHPLTYTAPINSLRAANDHRDDVAHAHQRRHRPPSPADRGRDG